MTIRSPSGAAMEEHTGSRAGACGGEQARSEPSVRHDDQEPERSTHRGAPAAKQEQVLVLRSMTTSQFTEDFKLLIGGSWVDGAHGTYPIVNPATEGVVGLAPEASAEQAEAAAGAAAEAFHSWSRTTPEER